MQNNPFNLLSQLQSAAGAANASSGQDSSGQSMWNNAALMGAMQNMLSRGGSSTTSNLPGNVLSAMGQQSFANKPPAANESSVDMNIFRQFQLQQNQATSSQARNPPQPAANMSGTATAIPEWNNPQLGATHAAGTNASGGGASAVNNPLMSVMAQSLLSQQISQMQQQQQQQQQQANPMLGLMQFMQMMPLAAMMPNMGTQLPSMDPNLARQLLVQLLGQLQQSGQLGNDDSLQKLLQQAAGGPAQGAGNVITPPAEVISIQPDGSEEQNTDEVMHAPGPASGKKKSKGMKAKTSVAENVVTQVKATAPVLHSNVATVPENRSRQTKKQTDIKFDDARKETDKRGLRNSPLKSEPRSKSGLQSKSIEALKKASSLVVVDSDEDDDTTSNSSIIEENKGKKPSARGISKAKPQEKQAKKSPVTASKVNQKNNKDGAKSSVLEFPLQRIKVEDANEDEASGGQSISPRHESISVSEKVAEVGVMPQIKMEADWKTPSVPLGVNLRRCEVRLERLKRDANGKFIVPLSLKKVTGGEKAMVFKTEPRSPVRSESLLAKKKDDQPPPINVQLLPNLNAAIDPQMRTIFVGHLNGNMQWLSLVGWAASRSFCQCPFCPILSDTPKPILSHIRTDHADLTFALTKMKPPTGKYLYLFCRHCDFVAVDVTINWLHFEVYHNVSDILEGTARPRIEDFAPVKLEIIHRLEDVMDTVQSYMCYDCELISDDSKQVAIHVLHEHPNTPHYNGCFVKLLGLRKPLKSENVSYKHIISDDEFTEFRQEAFICMMCEYIAHCPYMALSHNLITHQTKRVLFECMAGGCSFNCITDAAMIQHLSSKHRLKADLCCSTTLLEPRVDGYVECVITVNRKSSKQASLQRCHPPATENANGNADEGDPSVQTSDEENGNEDDKTDEETGESKKKKKKSSKPRVKAVKDEVKKTSENGNEMDEEEEEKEEEENMEEDKMPEDVKITINPPSPDDTNDSPNSPGSDNSGDTIVDDVPDTGNAENEEEEEEESTSNTNDVAKQKLSEDSGDVENAADNGKEKVDSTHPLSGSEDETDVNSGEKAKDFMAEIPLEPCCLSTDIYLPVPNSDICTFDSAADVEGDNMSLD